MAKEFYFAWVDAGTEFDPEVHNVNDEDVFSHEFSHEEGGLAALSLVIRNPRIGLLNPGRKIWAWYSWNQADVGDPPNIIPLFFGRIIGLPENIFNTLVTINFIARPSDFVDQKIALAETLKELPYWDPIFVKPESWEDPDTILEARSALWHVDPVTHVVTISDILTPEDGVIDHSPDDTFYESMSLTLETVPLRSVTIQATIPWTQTAQGGLSLAQTILNQFPENGYQLISSFTLGGLVSSWPKDGAKIGNGWQVITGSLLDVSSRSVPPLTIHPIFDTSSVPTLAEGSIFFPVKTTGKIWGGVDGAGFDLQYEIVGVAMGYGIPTLNVSYAANRELAQIVNFTMYTDQQSIATEASEDETAVISLTANKVSDLSWGDDVPIGDIRRRDFIHTARGMQAVEHLILVARATLVGRSRAVKISFQTDFETGLEFTLRKSATVHDERLPGGTATGKITSVTHSLDGEDGAALATITIACAIGYGGNHIPNSGDPLWFDEGYIDREYQEYSGDEVLTVTEDIKWAMTPYVEFDDGLDFIRGLTPENAILALGVLNHADIQREVIMAASAGELTDQEAINSALQEVPTQISLQLVPMEGGPFVQVVDIAVSDLIVPKQIDLEAPSV
jgi:hypothetical protein